MSAPADLASCLDGLRRRRGLSYEAMEKEAAKLRSQPGGSRWEPLAKTTVGEIVTGKRLPTKDKLRTFLAVCGVSPADLAQWLAAWERAVTVNQSILGIPLRQALASGAAAYEVHPSIIVNTATPGDLPSYVSRLHDRQLAKVVQAAIGGYSQIAVLVGASSTGKTRACWEILHTLPDNWRIWHPLTGNDLLTGLQEARKDGPVLAPRTVIWLNELQRYLLPPDPAQGEKTAVALRVLLTEPGARPFLVLGSIWPDGDRWGALTRQPAPGHPDRHHQARELLTGAGIVVPDHIGPGYADAEKAAQADPRWQIALSQDPNRPIQYLAGAAYLLQRYTDATPAERAVLEAAGDARRVGAPQHLPLTFLQEAARDYLSDVEWRRIPRDRRSNWVTDAIDDPATGLRIGGRGVDGPLREPRHLGDSTVHNQGPVYELADYLEQHLRRERATIQPRDSLWDAAAVSFSDPPTLESLARAARCRGRLRYAIDLYQRAIAAGQTHAWDDLAELLEQTGNRDGAQHAAHQAAAAGDRHVWVRLARIREDAGDRDGAEQAYREAVGDADEYDWMRLVTFLEQTADQDRAEEAADRAAAAGHPDVWFDLARLRERAGHFDAAERAYRRAAAVGDVDVWGIIARVREQAGDRPGAEQIARELATFRDPYAWAELARLREQAGDRVGAEQAARQAVAVGDRQVWSTLARLRARARDRDGAEQAYREAVAVGESKAWVILADFREQAGDLDGAEDAYRQAIAAGHLDAWDGLAELSEQAGDRVGAEQAARQATAAGRLYIWTRLAQARERLGDLEPAERAAREAIAAGDWHGWVELARVLEQSGDRVGAEQAAAAGKPDSWLRLAAPRRRPGEGDRANKSATRLNPYQFNRDGWIGLAELREQVGDRKGAEQAYRQAAAAGNPYASTFLIEFLERVGDRDGAEETAQHAAASGDPHLWNTLAALREHAGDREGAEQAYIRAAGGGDSYAWVERAMLYERAGDRHGAEHAYREAAAVGVDEVTWHMLARLREEAGDHGSAERIRRFGITAEGLPETGL